jgi:hypothetical protein
MTEVKHSPAPWSIEGSHGRYQDSLCDANGQAVAAIWTRKSYPKADDLCPSLTGEANARLIAAAPDLLEALKGIVCEYEDSFHDPRLDQARAAIAKAEGRA